MAKIKFGMMMTDARGKLGGQVFSKNKGGAYVRTKVTPANPQTASQSGVRALFGTISSTWSTLTEAQRVAWNAAVESWKSTDIFGDLLAPTGKALFQRLNNQLQDVGGSPITSPPAKVALPDAIITASVYDISSVTLTNTGQYATIGTYVSIYATAPLTQGTSFVKNRLRKIYSADAATATAALQAAAYVAKFGTPTAGDNVYIGVKYVGTNGQASPLQVIKALVQA